MRKIVFSVFLLLITFLGSAQETQKNIDSLLTVLSNSKADTAKVRLYKQIASHYNVTHLDSAKAFAEEGIVLARQLVYPQGEWEGLNVLGNYFERKNDYEAALKTYNEALDIVKATESTKGFAVVLNNIATIYIRKGEYDEALTYMFEGLKAEEALENQNGIAQAYNNIGVAYYYIQDFDKTTFYLTKALEIQESLGNFDGLINGYNNVGAIRIHQEKYDEAITVYEKALSISTKISDRKNQAIALSNIGICWTMLKDYSKSEQFYDRSLALRDQIGDLDGKANSLVNMGTLFIEQGNFLKAEVYLNRGMEIANRNGLKTIKEGGYQGLSNLFEAKGDYKKSNAYLKEYVAVKDSILNEDNARIIAETETKYETEKKEKELLEHRALIAEKELEVKQKNTMLFGSLGLALLLGLLGYLFYSQQRLKNRQLQKESELKTALAKIETQNRLQEQRLRISRDLHDNIGAQLTFIISSLDNLKYGFKDMGDKLSDRLSGISGFTSQTIYELRDTIWAMNKENITFEDLQARISNFIEQAKVASENTSFSFKIASEVNKEHLLSSVEGMNSYRIIQEAVNNALKYSEATTIDVTISEKNKVIRIAIEDNGKGFNQNEIVEGNGLNNMKKRARDLGVKLEVTSALGEGTAVVLTLNK